MDYPTHCCQRVARPRLSLVLAGLLFLAGPTRGADQAAAPFTNSLGMRMLPIRPGSFQMGERLKTPKDVFGQAEYLARGDWDEHPVHEVTLTRPFFIAE